MSAKVVDLAAGDRNTGSVADSRRRRDQIQRTGELRRTLRFGSLLVGVILLLTGFILAARFPGRATPLFLLWTTGALASFALFLIARRAPHRFVVPLTVVFTVNPAAALLATAVEPGALLSMASGFTMLPVAVPLFLAWARPLRTGWLIAYAAVFAGVTLTTGLGYLAVGQRVDLASNVFIGTFIGWVGGELLERLRQRSLEQEIELRRLNRELHVRATTDSLTGLSNRRQLESDLQVLSIAGPGASLSTAFIMMDLDRFKRLNDELGHALGDAALRSVSAELRSVVRGSDTIYRYGGEEFLVIMPGASLESATAAAERIRAAIGDLRIKASAGPAPVTLTISCGVALSHGARRKWEALFAAADSALYEAKATGRNRVCVVPEGNGDEPPPLSRLDRRRAAARAAGTSIGDDPARRAG